MFLQGTKSEEQLRGEQLNRGLSKVTARFEHVQFDAGRGGWIPQEGGVSVAENLAQLIESGRIDEATDLLEQLKNSPDVTSSTARRAGVNSGPTRAPAFVLSNAKAKDGENPTGRAMRATAKKSGKSAGLRIG